MYSRKKEPARVTALVSARHHQPRCEQAPGRRCQSSSQNVERGEVLELRTQRQGTLFPKSKDRANSSWLLVTWRRVRVQSTTNKVASLETLADMGAVSKSGWGGEAAACTQGQDCDRRMCQALSQSPRRDRSPPGSGPEQALGPSEREEDRHPLWEPAIARQPHGKLIPNASLSVENPRAGRGNARGPLLKKAQVDVTPSSPRG